MTQQLTPMTKNEQEKKNRKRKLDDINIENEDEKLVNGEEEKKNYIFNEDVHQPIKFEYDIKTKLEICNYSETTKITNSWKILQYFRYKYPTLREDSVKSWIKLGSQYFTSQTNNNDLKRKRIRKNTQGYFQALESMLVEEIIEREKKGLIRDSKWCRMRAKELHEEHKEKFGWSEFDASRGWLIKFLKRHNEKLCLRKPTTNHKMSFDEYVLKWNDWIKEERKFLIEIKNKNQLNSSIENYIYNIDEIPIVLQSNKPMKQFSTIDAEMVQVKQAYLTRIQNTVQPQLFQLLQPIVICQYG
jgi:Tc5 transposase-like DNA-binding protein